MNIHIQRDDLQYGPYSLEETLKFLADGSLLSTDLAWHEGATDWIPLSRVGEIEAFDGSLVLPAARPAGPAPETVILLHPRVWTIFFTYLLTLGFYLLGTGILVVLWVIFHSGAKAVSQENVLESIVTQPAAFLTLAVFGQSIVGGAALIGAFLSPMPIKKRLFWRPSNISWPGMALLMLGAVALSQCFGVVISLSHVELSGTIKMLSEALGAMRGVTFLMAVIVLGVAPGICEEMLFRGYIQTRLSQRWGGRIAVGISALLFAIFHLDLIQGLFVLMLGVYVGTMVEKTSSLRPAMLCHGAGNTIAILSSHFMGNIEPGLKTNLILLGICVSILGVAIGYLWRLPQQTVEP